MGTTPTPGATPVSTSAQPAVSSTGTSTGSGCLLAICRRRCDDRDTMDDELSPSEAAKRIGTTTRSVQRWIAIGQLPARRVGGRWRVASDAFDAFMQESRSRQPPPTDGPERRRADPRPRSDPSSSPIVARSLSGSRGPAPASGSAPSSPPPTARAPSTSSTSPRSWRRHARPAPTPSIRASGSSPRTPTSPTPSRLPGCAGSGPPPHAIRAMGDKAAARALAAAPRRPDPARLRRRRPDGRGTHRRGSPDRLAARSSNPRPEAAARGCTSSATRSTRGRAGGRSTRGAGRVRRRPARPRAVGRGRAPRRGPGPVRCARERRPPRRARLLAPAPPPEDPRGDAVAGRHARPPPPTDGGRARPWPARSAT